MRSNRLWIGATCAVALALGAVAAVDAGTQTAGAQADSTVSPQQLKISQNISSAACEAEQPVAQLPGADPHDP